MKLTLVSRIISVDWCFFIYFFTERKKGEKTMKWKRAIVSLLVAALCLTNVMQPLSVHAEEFVTFGSETSESESEDTKSKLSRE